MATAKKPTPKFDLAQFEKMRPPFRFRIERRTNRGDFEPIPLPQEVWSKEDAAQIENIILNDVSGGGSYKAQMIDEGGNSMEWSFHYPTDSFPAKIPPGAAAAVYNPGASGPAPASAAAPSWSRGQYGTPVTPPSPAFVPPYQAPSMPAMGGAQLGYAGWTPPQGAMYPPYSYYSPPPASTPRDKESSAERHLREQLDSFKQQAIEERHAREREAQENRYRAQLQEMHTKHSEEMRQLREMLQQQQQAKPRSEDDPALLALKQQIEAQKAAAEEQRRQFEEQRRQFEQQQAEVRHREELRQMQQNSQQQIDALKEMMREAAANKQDPTMITLIEMQRQQAEAMREQARVQAELQREATRTASETPRQMVDMMERLRSAGGMEQMLASMNSSWTGLMSQQRAVLEMVMNMGPDPKMALLEGGLSAGKEVLERFIDAKKSGDIARERTEQVKAQERAVHAQAQAQAYAAQVAATQPVYRDENGNIKGQPPTREQLQGGQDAPPAEAAAEAAPTNKKPTEADVFGPIYDDVKQLRAAVASGDVTPETIAMITIQAAHEIEKQGAVVPIFRLYAEQRFAELYEYMLPDASTEFHGACVQHLLAKLRELGITPGKTDVTIIDDDVDDDEDDGEDDDDADGAIVAGGSPPNGQPRA